MDWVDNARSLCALETYFRHYVSVVNKHTYWINQTLRSCFICCFHLLKKVDHIKRRIWSLLQQTTLL